jgi:hypothetical protein
VRLYTCEICGAITSNPYCSRHQPRRPDAHRSANRDRAKQADFRRRVLSRDGHRCQICGSDQDLRACHWPKPLRDYVAGDARAYATSSGLTMCAQCDQRLDGYARASRAGNSIKGGACNHEPRDAKSPFHGSAKINLRAQLSSRPGKSRLA